MANEMTTVPVVLDTLVEVIGDMLVGQGLEGNDVAVTHAARIDQRTYDDVYIGDVEDHFNSVATMKAGRKSRDEEYRIVINIFVVRDEPRDANEQAMFIAGIIEDWMAVNPGLGLDIPTLRVTDWEFSLNMTYDDASVWRSHVSMRPTVRVRLT